MAFEFGYNSIKGELTGMATQAVVIRTSGLSISKNILTGQLVFDSSLDFYDINVDYTSKDICVYENCSITAQLKTTSVLSFYAYFDTQWIMSWGTSNSVNKVRLLCYNYNGIDYCGIAFSSSESSTIASVLLFDTTYYNIKSVNKSDEYGNASTIGGYSDGTFDDSSDTIPIPDLPTIGYCSTGGYAYKLSTGELNSLVNEIFVDYTPIESGDTGLEKVGIMLENVALTLQQMLNSQFVQYVTDVHIVPVAPPTGGVENIKLGSRSMNTTSTRITNDYIEIDCGTLNIGEYYANYIDYSGTTCKLYLPFVGFVDVKNEWFQSGYLNVTYHYNVIDGTFMCFLKSSSSKSNLRNTVVASYGGSCCVHLPFVGSDYSNVLSGLVSTVNGASSIVGEGNIGGAVNSATQLLNNLGGTVNGSNDYNSNSAYLGIRTPYLYIERIVSSFSETYANENGLPTNVSIEISELTGYSEIENIHLDNVNCSDEEKSELLTLLQNGVIF